MVEPLTLARVVSRLEVAVLYDYKLSGHQFHVLVFKPTDEEEAT